MGTLNGVSGACTLHDALDRDPNLCAGGERVSESVCADKPHEYYNNKDWDVPKAEKPDF